MPLRTAENLERSVEEFNTILRLAVTEATTTTAVTLNHSPLPNIIKEKIKEKRKLRKEWQNSRNIVTKRKLNKTIRELKVILHEEKNDQIKNYLQNLTPMEDTDYSLWKATKRINKPQKFIAPIRKETGEWARSDKEKGQAFARHLEGVFKPYDRVIPFVEEQLLLTPYESTPPDETPIAAAKITEIMEIIRNIKPKKAPGHDSITGRMLKELPPIAYRAITIIINACLRLSHFPTQWKESQIILIQKPGKEADKVSSYRPISLLPGQIFIDWTSIIKLVTAVGFSKKTIIIYGPGNAVPRAAQAVGSLTQEAIRNLAPWCRRKKRKHFTTARRNARRSYNNVNGHHDVGWAHDEHDNHDFGRYNSDQYFNADAIRDVQDTYWTGIRRNNSTGSLVLHTGKWRTGLKYYDAKGDASGGGHPIPRIEDIFASLKGGEEFTKLDLEWAYNQLELDDESSKLLAWSTHIGVYKVKRLAFGPKTACSLFQEKIEEIVRHIDGCKNYFDDLIVTGGNREEHLNNLDKVFHALNEKGLKLKKGKCEFLQPHVKYLGYIIDKNGLRKDPDSIKAIVNLDKPKNITEVQAFTGMVNYYMKFTPNLSTLLSPIYQLLKKNTPFVWSEKCDNAFADTSDNILVHYDPALKLKLNTDTSNVGLGAVLMHVFPDGTEKPICFASRTLSKAEQRYAVIHKEALAIYWSCKKFYQYLIGRHFDLYCDHKPLMAIFGEKRDIPQMIAGQLQRWACFLSGFNYTFKYVKRKDNGGADGLSRLPAPSEEPDEEEIDFVRFIVEDKLPVDYAQIKKSTRTDPVLSKVFMYTRDGWPENVDDTLKPYFHRLTEISIEQDVLIWGYRVLIPEKHRVRMLEELHSTHLGAVTRE
ncbi:unnamed protein product [Trichogramma brassicae]|uniref:RNA-directed DNA polymerase n=1 Tax=Trichogramma brassicae TaxID=86971 RepID=A0A6H5IDQ8_9HYME|nr:unnamed protein product [Trichogramma brassicae]